LRMAYRARVCEGKEMSATILIAIFLVVLIVIVIVPTYILFERVADMISKFGFSEGVHFIWLGFWIIVVTVIVLAFLGYLELRWWYKRT